MVITGTDHNREHDTEGITVFCCMIPCNMLIRSLLLHSPLRILNFVGSHNWINVWLGQ
jgi:hypothetical protein